MLRKFSSEIQIMKRYSYLQILYKKRASVIAISFYELKDNSNLGMVKRKCLLK